MTDVLTPRPGGPERDDPIDWSECPMARAYRRSDGVVSYRSPAQLARPGARGPAHTLAVHRNRSLKP